MLDGIKQSLALLFAGDTLRSLEEAAREKRALAGEVERITLERDQMAMILGNMADGIIVTDGDNRIQFANQALFKVLPLSGSPQTILGSHFVTVIGNHELAGMLDEARISGQAISREVELSFPEQMQILAYFSPVSGQGPETSMVMVFHDITKLRRLESVRQDFVANVSHELRTPLASIKAMIETVLGCGREDSRLVDRFLGNINLEINRLHNIIADLLQLSQIESAAVTERRERVDLRNLLQETVEQFMPKAEEMQKGLDYELGEDLTVTGDVSRLKQVFINLIDNALKFTPTGGSIRIGALRSKDQVTVRIADNGIGIPQADCDRIFERFYRVDKARSRAMGGTGLGLAIVKHIVEGHQGSVSVTSREGYGSVFTISLPAIEEEDIS